MNSVRLTLVTGMMIISSFLLAQSKGEMPFTSSSSDAKKLLRSAWVAYGDVKFDDAGRYTNEALQKDPEFGMAHAFIRTDDDAEREKNLKKAAACQLSPDERMLVEGLLAAQSHKPVADYFEPLLAKYPKDHYLNLMIIFNYQESKRRTELGEMMTKRNPKFAPAYNLLGYDYLAQGDLKKAELNFDKYLSLSPNLANAYDSKADYLMRAGRIEEAIPLFEKAAQLGMAASTGRADVAKAKLKYPRPSETDMQEIKNVINATSAAYLKGDVDAILKNYAGQSLEFYPNQLINPGSANIRSRIEDPFKYGSFTKMDRSVEFIDGTGPIAVAWARTQSAFKSTSGEVFEDQRDDIFLFRKQQDGQWQILTHHWIGVNQDANSETSKNNSDIRQVLDKWSFFIKPGEIFSQEHVEKLAAIYSSQAVEIMPNQRPFIGMANLRLRWTGFSGIKWAQFTAVPFDINSFATVGPEGLARRAVAWGIGDHSNYAKGSDELSQYLFPWAMILTREKDGQWRILVYHFYLG